MLYALWSHDRPGTLEQRLATRPRHVERIKALIAEGRLILAGPRPVADAADAPRIPWVHLDIAGPADTTSAWDENARGGTGFGVRTLVNLLATWSKLPD